jgi:hypothetical protein
MLHGCAIQETHCIYVVDGSTCASSSIVSCLARSVHIKSNLPPAQDVCFVGLEINYVSFHDQKILNSILYFSQQSERKKIGFLSISESTGK